jgi:hypothetical protein
MRRRPSICDACERFRQRPNPDMATMGDRFIAYCDAFPDVIPVEIHLGGLDHRDAFPADRGVRFELRVGGERALRAFEHRVAMTAERQSP